MQKAAQEALQIKNKSRRFTAGSFLCGGLDIWIIPVEEITANASSKEDYRPDSGFYRCSPQVHSRV